MIEAMQNVNLLYQDNEFLFYLAKSTFLEWHDATSHH